VLEGHPAVAEPIVAGARVRPRERHKRAACVPRVACQAAELVAYRTSRLPAHTVPRHVEFRAELPGSPLGKVRRGELQPSRASATDASGPADQAERNDQTRSSWMRCGVCYVGRFD
jgi:acyl-coenzyme A synthetase/AMP-(fatty) acid ligase